ncbi:MAG: sugar ABC transporter substrate-binding protein, partial [Microbacterium sp.]
MNLGKARTGRRILTVGTVAVVTTTLLLTGCTSGGNGNAQGPSDEVTSFDWKNFEGTQLNVMLSQHPLATAIEKKLPEFEKLTGIKVKTESLSETDYFTKLLAELQSKSGNYDAFMTGATVNWQYASAGWSEDLQPWIDNPKATSPDWNVDDFYPSTLDMLKWDKTNFGGLGKGSQWSIPANQEGYALFYRKDILDAAGIQVPSTIDELIAAAKKLNGTEFDGKKINGFVARGDKTWPTLLPFASFLKTYGGADVVDGKSGADSPEAVEAVTKWVELMQYAPKAASTFTWYEAQQDFLAGNTAFYLDADHMAEAFEADGSAIKGKVGYALPPEGPDGRKSGMWLWSLGMNAASSHKDAAWLFIQWATSSEFLTAAIAEHNINPPRKSAAQSAEMAEMTKEWGDYNEIWQQILSDYAEWPYSPSASWTELGDTWATGIQSAVIGEKSVEDAMKDTAKKID